MKYRNPNCGGILEEYERLIDTVRIFKSTAVERESLLKLKDLKKEIDASKSEIKSLTHVRCKDCGSLNTYDIGKNLGRFRCMDCGRTTYA